ncbi:acyl-CoA dehydrogenase [Stutzerimonas stutzeri]|uniref:Acyl-CoA dehydrogenase n=1 Tax=Stutzerimonas stutzeri TaxID=316 RepID=W8RR51_STUST|nr:acyl-CoA dehydrogenase [Stutzerimonas stutzeri]AHL74491.1 acyl-CoA dehydrogenase [Stutzerimonas stutzeri]MCQ4329018.1 acyl-CoA dehydrogenase [Stutzerimonas stutzeri]
MFWHELLVPLQRLPPPAALDDWFADLQSRGANGPFELAVLGGRLAATPGLAFLAGYQAALRRLWPAAPEGLGALCATENRSLRPADMLTRLDELLLTGCKDFVTAGSAATWLLVPARDEAPGEPPRLSLCVVGCGERGVIVEARPPLPLLVDIPHGRLRLEGAACRRLAGDGWDDYVKPFRTLEDLHVLAALVSWLYGLSLECGWPQRLQLQLLGLLAGAAEVSRLSPAESATHLLLASLNLQFAGLADEVEAALALGPRQWLDLWQRDRGVLQLARGAQAKRLAQAAKGFGLTPEGDQG